MRWKLIVVATIALAGCSSSKNIAYDIKTLPNGRVFVAGVVDSIL